MSWMWRRKNVVGGVAVGVLAATAVIVGTVGGPEDVVMPDMGPDGRGSGAVVLDLLAPRDFGALAPRGTGAGQWCGPLTRGGTDYPAHCWELQQSTGDATDTGAVGGWHLSPTGTPRAGVATGLPVEGGAAVDWTSELGTWADGSAATGWTKAAVSLSATSLVSITAVVRSEPGATFGAILAQRDSTAPNVGWVFNISGATGVAAVLVDYGPSTINLTGTTDTSYGSHCITVVVDARGASQGRVFLDGADDTNVSDLSAAAGFMTAADIRIHGWANSASYTSAHGISRVRIDDGAAVTLAQHRALCGSYGLSLKASHRAANDTTWTQSGGARCYPGGAPAATCYPGGAPAATWDASGWRWAVDGQGAVNRVTYSTAIDCTNWTCIGAVTAVPGATAPDGSATASTATVGAGANHLEMDPISGYTVSTQLNLVFWAKCSSGTAHPHADNTGTRGDWDVDCSCVGGAWRRLHAADACVTVNTAWTSDGAGQTGFHVDGTAGGITIDLWAPTLTEEPTTGAVVPTAAAAVSTGQVAWLINNASTRYGVATSTYTSVLDTVDGTCLETGSTIRLSGGSGTECVGAWESLQVRR